MSLYLCEREDRRCPSYSKEDYPYIQRGFIVPNFRLRNALCTYWQPNNETANVYTQLAGVVVFMWMICRLWMIPLHELTDAQEIGTTDPGDIAARRVWLTVTIASATLCGISSLLTHMFQAHSRRWHSILAGALFVPFVAVIANDNVDSSTIIEKEAPMWLRPFLHLCTGHVHLTLVTLILLATLAVLTFARTNHHMRFWLVFGSIVTTCLPTVMLCFCVNTQLTCAGVLGFVVGGLFFGTHLPEKCCPRRFDICCPSHCLWHVGYLTGLTIVMCSIARIFLGQTPWFIDF